MRSIARLCAATLLVLPAPLRAQDHVHPPSAAVQLGSVHFPTSCAPAVSADFDRSIALLHSFEFRGAISGFTGVLATDSTCAMAQWGIALARWTNPMVQSNRLPAVLAEGQKAANAAERLSAHAT